MRTPTSYRSYERRRLGNPTNTWAGIACMFRRSFGAASLGGFWRYWNPLFSYYLYYRCYRPLFRFVPRALAVVLTFAVSGAVHDLAASLAIGHFFVLFILFSQFSVSWSSSKRRWDEFLVGAILAPYGRPRDSHFVRGSGRRYSQVNLGLTKS